MEGHDDFCERPPAEVTVEELQQRAKIMLSGKTGAAVASGDGAATTALTYGLVRDVGIVISPVSLRFSPNL